MWVDLPLQEGIAPREQLVAAIRTARKLGRIPVVDMSAPWCGPCRNVEHLVKGPKMRAAGQHMYVIKINWDYWKDALGKLGFDVNGIPKWFVVDKSGRPVGEHWQPGMVASSLAPMGISFDKIGQDEAYRVTLRALFARAKQQF